jgi:hypothetical protein
MGFWESGVLEAQIDLIDLGSFLDRLLLGDLWELGLVRDMMGVLVLFFGVCR